MNAREIYDAIQRGDRESNQQVLFELLALMQTVSTAVLEVDGEAKLATANGPLSERSRLILSEFIELKGPRS